MPQTSRHFAIIGLGSFGSTVGGELARFDNHVIGLDVKAERVNAMAEKLSQAMIADARDEAALREAGVGDCDVALIAVGDDMEASVLSLINLKLLGVGEIWAKANSKAHHRILSKLGADRVVQPEEQMGLHIAQMLHNPFVRDYVSLGNGLHVVNFRVPESLEGRKLADLDLMTRYELRCVGIMRGTEFVGRDGEACVLESADRLLLLGTRGNLRKFGASL
ncbi:TrkA family potassium uptake protein [Rhodobacteraceae bacterium CCMM004]|nr:TrkA family potassium uptake protein [Rhodobacteraceae bacterium CCMM004]